MAKIETVTLKEMEIVENEEGEFEQRFINEQRLPAAITNYSLSMGEKLGLIRSSQLTDLTDVQQLWQAAIGEGMNEEEAMKDIDMSKFLKGIYLAIIGVNPDMNMTYDEFTKLYNEDTSTLVSTYTDLVLNSVTEDANNFAQGMEKSTKKKEQKTV